jgi:hypothetical protein
VKRLRRLIEDRRRARRVVRELWLPSGFGDIQFTARALAALKREDER